jgi:hypothetical protein
MTGLRATSVAASMGAVAVTVGAVVSATGSVLHPARIKEAQMAVMSNSAFFLIVAPFTYADNAKNVP